MISLRAALGKPLDCPSAQSITCCRIRPSLLYSLASQSVRDDDILGVLIFRRWCSFPAILTSSARPSVSRQSDNTGLYLRWDKQHGLKSTLRLVHGLL